jgi:hypothetical protein
VRGVIATIAMLLVACGIGVAWAGPDRPAPRWPDPVTVAPEPEPAPAPAATVPTTTAPPTPQPPPTQAVGPDTRPPSRAIGLPFRGRLSGGVPFPPEGIDHFTWDPVLKQSPNRVWRRYGTDRTVARILRTLAAFRRAHPESPPVGGGGPVPPARRRVRPALRRPRPRVAPERPRRRRLLPAARPPAEEAVRPAEVDRALAQALVDAFVRAGATHVFVGPSLRIRGPRGIVQPLVHHDDHLHARFRP